MKTQKILILGITGNLAKLKILPAIGQYYDLHSNEVNIELYGYSRSQPNVEELNILIQSQIKSVQNLPKITLVQGEYIDNAFYSELVASLGDNDSLVVYLAVPPSVYTTFLQNSCPYSKRPIDILIEKPFGESIEEAQNILKIVSECDLHQRVHFLDHYLFKSIVQLDILQIQQELSYNNLSFGKVTRVQIQALEIVDVKERGGYYDTNGAIKDMFPHLYSLYNYCLGFFGNPKIDNNNWKVNNLKTSQYEGYKNDVGNPKSKTESYFMADMSISTFGKKILQLVMESGKQQPQKITQMTIEFESKSQLIFQIAPKSFVRLVDSKGKIIKSFLIEASDKIDHTRVFENVFAGNFDHFVPSGKVLEYWNLYEKIVAQNKPGFEL
jgi:glucose-6-phosphate 1-dehydrogenase